MFSVLRSTSVRLALAYTALFVLSSLLLVGLLWWRTAEYLARRTDAEIKNDGIEIADQLRHFGLIGAQEAIDARIAEEPEGRAIYLLVDSSRKPLAGNLPAWPAMVAEQPGWYRGEIVRDAVPHTFRLRRVALPDGFMLLLGRDVEDRAELREVIVEALGWAGASALVLAIAGAILLRRAVLRRVEMINEAATAIVRGDLARRVPTRDGADAFDQLGRTINAMLQQIQQLVEGVRNTANAVAHDLRTPLAELRARLEELARARPPAEATAEEIAKAVGDIDRVISVFNALLRLAEIDSGVRRAGFRRVELGALATEVAELYGLLAEEKGIAFELVAPAGAAVVGDPYLLAQAVGNLVDNAVKYAPPGGRVALRIAHTADRQIEIAVADDGPGIPDEEKPYAMQRFYRCRASEAKAGIGLGLSLVDAVARLHEGSLTLADNAPGLLAALRLPAPPPLAPSARAAAAAPFPARPSLEIARPP
jgi:signal transduction histidine kinase